MQLYIIGKDTEDKGNQLEELTQIILEQKSVKNLCRSKISSGGDEIDVSGIIHNTALSDIEIPIICECKAHSNPINLTDWLKFLGKFFVKSLDNCRTQGYLISLSGANGNVLGAYDDLKKKCDSVKFITGDELVALLTSYYKLPTKKDVIDFVTQYTDKQINDISLMYYSKQVYWVISFISGEFTLLESQQGFIPIDKYKQLNPYIEKFTDLSKFIDIESENKALHRKRYIEGQILFNCINQNLITYDELFQNLSSQKDLNVTKEEIIIYTNEIPFIENSNSQITLKKVSEIDVVEFYRYILHRPIKPELLEYSFYKDNINDILLSSIETIQCGMPIPKEKRKDCISILQLSPSALIYAITPDTAILQGRHLKQVISDDINNKHFDMFMGNVIDCLTLDLKSQPFHDVFLHKLGIKSFSINRTLVINENEENQIIFRHAPILKYGVLSGFEQNPTILINSFDNSSLE